MEILELKNLVGPKSILEMTAERDSKLDYSLIEIIWSEEQWEKRLEKKKWTETQGSEEQYRKV